MRRVSIVLSVAILALLGITLAACNTSTPTPEPVSTPTPTVDAAGENTQARGPGMMHGNGRGMGAPAGMRERHRAPVPPEYAGLTNPIPADDASLQRGADIYTQYCASCHGDGGMGDGPAGTALNPPPAPVAHTSQMLGDDRLFWRISEGGAAFGTAMPAFKEVLDEQARWDVINYIRALGSGQVPPQQRVGGRAYNPAEEAARHAEMLATAVQQGILTQQEADFFAAIHDKLEAYRQQHMEELRQQGAGNTDMMNVILAALVEQHTITQEEADRFQEIHDRLVDAGLMK